MSNLNVSRAERLDQRVVALLPLLSRSFATRLITDGKVSVNNSIVTKAGTKLRPNDTVAVDYEPSAFTIPDIDIPILYEDTDCVVIDKPIGLLTHSKGSFNPEPSVATWLHNRITDKTLIAADEYQPNNRAGIVHRLDRATSGVMICAKTSSALKWLQKQFADRHVSKTYMAVVSGAMEPVEAIIDMPIGRNPKAPATFRVGMQGKSARTAYKVLDIYQQHSLLELRPETGRTHQLRVHLSHQHHPIVGDTMYGGEPADRLYLHAMQLEIPMPGSRERMLFTAPLPATFTELLS